MKDVIETRALVVAQAVLAVVFAGVACVPTPTEPDGGDTIVNVNQTVTQGGGPNGTNPSPSPGTCGPVTEVTNGLLGTGGVKNATLRLGPPAQSVPLDTTPNRNADEHCNTFRRVAWAVTQGTVVCRLDNPESYTPTVTAAGLGTCVIRASIQGVSASEPITINVVP